MKTRQGIRLFPVTAAVVLGLVFSACGNGPDRPVDVADGETREGDVNVVNASITLGEESEVKGNLRSVNGAVELGSGARAGTVETVNGRVRIGSDGETGEVSTVNGSIRLGEDGRVRGEISSINGSVTLKAGSEVSGDISTVNGNIRVESARIEGSLSTRTGDVSLLDGSHLAGDLTVDRVQRGDRDRRPRVVIGPDTVVEGTIRAARRIELHVHESASIGDVEGVEPKSFSGARPGD